MAKILISVERGAARRLPCARPSIPSVPAGGPVLADAVLSLLLVLCHGLAVPAAAARALALAVRDAELRTWLRARPGGARHSLRRIAFARLARQALKLFILAGAERTALRRVDVEPETLPPGSCVWAIPHSAWLRLLAVWAKDRNAGLALAGNGWAGRLGTRSAGTDLHGLLRLVRHLRAGGRAAVAADSFVARDACEARFLGYPTRVSTVAVRVAAAGRVPVVPVWPSYADGALRLEFGPAIPAPRDHAGQAETARALLDFFERRIARDPAQWNDLVPFFRKHARRAPHDTGTV